MNKNLNWVTALKGFGIIAVILGHIASPFSEFIYSWHMPLFFIISGFFINTKTDLKTFIIKDWKRLMIPYFIFAFLALAITSLKFWGLERGTLNYLDEVIAILFWMDYGHLKNSYSFVLWFLPALFFSKMLFNIVKKTILHPLYQLSVFIFLFVLSFYVQLPFGLSTAMNGVLWLFFGSILITFVVGKSRVHGGRDISELSLFIPFLVILVIGTSWGIPKLDMSSLIYVNKIVNILWALSWVLLLALLFDAITRKFNPTHLVKQWGSGTMLLFIFHPYSNNISHIVVEQLNFGGWALKLLISLALLQLLLMIKNRFNDRWIFKYV